MSTRKWTDRDFLNRARDRGEVKLALLLACAAVVLFLIATVGVQRSTAGDCNCGTCHSSAPHAAGWQGCGTCHGFPPATGSHVAHFEDLAGVVGNYQPYGSTTVAQDYYTDPNIPAPSYIMSCGNCHPMDNAKHQNGVVDVELYNAAAPPGSLKAQNPLSAAYTPGSTVYYDSNNLPYTLGTCSDVYCHSYNDWTTTGTVVLPWRRLLSPRRIDFSPPMPPNIVTTRYYQTATWGGASLTCSGCHDNPPRTTYLTNNSGGGNSHSWIGSDSYEAGHNGNMQGHNDPLDCKTCHNDTVRDASTWTRQTWNGWPNVAFFGDTPIHNYSKHVNGTLDVAFDTINSYQYLNTFMADPPSYDYLNLAGAGYDTATKTCSNVSCHLRQTTVIWGIPYRQWNGDECNRCHQM